MTNTSVEQVATVNVPAPKPDLKSIHGIEIWSYSDVIKSQDTIRKVLSETDSAIHANAVQCIIHASVHGDTSLMRRLLLNTIPDGKTGYRRQGLITWMRYFTPMELSGDVIKLTGIDEKGNRKPFDIIGAAKMPFWELTNEGAFLKPMYQDTLLQTITRAAKSFRDAIDNTNEFGKPKDKKKAFYDGKYRAEMEAFFEMIDAQTEGFLSKYEDDTAQIKRAQERLSKELGRPVEIKARKKAA